MKGAVIQDSNAESVTFSTVGFGLVTISRINGMLVRQSVTGTEGEERVLVASDIKVNPAKDEILSIFADWEEAAKIQPEDIFPSGSLGAPGRTHLFQDVINAVEQNQLPMEGLETKLEEQMDTLRDFSSACRFTAKGSIYRMEEQWQGFLKEANEKIRVIHKQLPEPSKSAPVQALFINPAVRERLRGQITGLILKQAPEMKQRVMKEIFAKQPEPSTDTGKAAWEKIQTALCSAYLESMAEAKMNEAWGEAAAE